MKLKAIVASCLMMALMLLFLPVMAQEDDPEPTLVDPLSNIQGENLIPQATPDAAEDADDAEVEIEATDEATPEVTDEPTEEPIDEPTEEPTEEPTDEPTQEPTEEPAATPTPAADDSVSSVPPARPDVIFDFGLTPIPFTQSLNFGGLFVSGSGAPGLLIVNGDVIFVFGLPFQLPSQTSTQSTAPQSGDIIFDFD